MNDRLIKSLVISVQKEAQRLNWLRKLYTEEDLNALPSFIFRDFHTISFEKF